MDLIKLARDVGFEDACPVNMESLTPLEAVRDMCASGRCRAYGTRWTCPPACGTIEHCAKLMHSYKNGILVQSIGMLEDEFDAENIYGTQDLHKKRFETLTRQFRVLYKDCLPLTAGTCKRCLVCTYPDQPCRYPNKRFPSMEAFGLMVNDVCTASGMPYNRGKLAIAYTSCILYNK